MEVINTASIPAADGTFGQTGLVVDDKFGGVEKLLDTNAVTTGTSPCWVIKRKQEWLQFFLAISAFRAGVAGRQQLFVIAVHSGDNS